MKLLTSWLLIFLYLVTNTCFAVTISELQPIHPRPFLLSEAEKQTLLKLIEDKDWAKKDFKNLQTKAGQGDGYSAAFLYAITEDRRYLDIAKTWLIKIAKNGGDIGPKALNVDDGFFEQGMPWLGDVFYFTNSKYLEAFDLIYNDLNPAEKETILNGINASTDFRIKSMDSWRQTANLVFKPTSMVAIAGLITQKPEFLNWGFFRKPESNLGGYFSALNNMLQDNGPWFEAPIYAVSHLPLYQSLKVSNLLSKVTGVDWFSRKLKNGSSVQGLMDYYIDTTYPNEIRPNGNSNYRILTYGDGATGQRGDTYLLTDNPLQQNLVKELTLAYRLSGDSDYAGFLKQVSDYKPDLIDQPELADTALLPKAKSSIWPNFGLAFLRSDHSRNYWQNPNSMALSLLFRQGYGHGHADALSITLFGVGQLFYPDYNAVQYENPAIGWTISSVAHNTVVVDGNNSSIPKNVKTKHTFNDEFRFVQASIEESLGIRKNRTLVLTSNYLLDIFNLNSLIPRTYDYLLHSFGRIESDQPDDYKFSPPFSTRYKNIKDFKTSFQNDNWKLDFVIDLEREQQNSKRVVDKFVDQNNTQEDVSKLFGLNSTGSFRAAKVNFAMTGGENTQIGLGEDDYGLSFLAARRKNTKQTTFIALHSPSYLDQHSIHENQIETIIDLKLASVVKVTTDSHIDIHAISHKSGETTLFDETKNIKVNFTDYAALRLNRHTKEISTYGDWHSYYIPKDIIKSHRDISFGEVDIIQTSTNNLNDHSIQIDVFPNTVVLKDFAESEFTLSLTNKTAKALSAKAQFPNNPNYQALTNSFSFGIIPAYKTAHQKVTIGRYKQTNGVDVLPLKITIDNSSEVIDHGIMVSAGPGLTHQFEGLDEPVYRIFTFDSTIDFSMRNGLIREVSSSKGKIFSGDSLFDLSDGETIFSPGRNTIQGSYTWANQKNSSTISEINNLIRWHMFTIQNRFYIKLDTVYTRLDKVFFVFDKTNQSFDWSAALHMKNGNPVALTKSKLINTNAVEIPFANSTYSLCVKTSGTMNWGNNDQDLSFSLLRDGKDQFGFGICARDSLASWAN